MSKTTPEDIVGGTLGLMIVIGFLGAVAFGMTWALFEGLGMDAAWPRGLTLMFSVPFGAAFVLLQFINLKP